MAGKTPGNSDKLKMNVKGAFTANRFNIAGVIPSGPGPLLTSKPRKVYSTSYLVFGDFSCGHFMTVVRSWQVTIWDLIILHVYALKKPSK
jgi:hypothetical protein